MGRQILKTTLADPPIGRQISKTTLADPLIGRHISKTTLADPLIGCQISKTTLADPPIGHQIFCFAICGSSASVKFYFFTFAQAEQAFIRNRQMNARKHFVHLRHKHRK